VPEISVVIPAHNGARFLAQAMESVAAQTHPPAETIVVDDGSTDETAAIASARAARVIRQRQRGVAAARNAGIAAAGGELIALLDQDDVWLAAKLERQLAALAEHPNALIARTHVQVLLEPGTPRPQWLLPSQVAEPFPGLTPSSWLVRREAFERIGLFDERYTTASDADWLLRLGESGAEHVMVQDPLTRWRVHDSNGSHNVETMHAERFAMLRRSAQRRRSSADGRR
jgi:glycosyltransferase involved in cell wall biosynthesis